MFPHPPTSTKTKNSRANIRPASQKFPGTGKSIKAPESTSGTSHKKSINKQGIRVNQPSLSPLTQAIDMKTRSTGKEKATKREDGASSSNQRARVVRSIEKRDSFSRYTPLPAIGSRDEKERKTKTSPPRTSGKRSLPKSSEKHYPQNSNNMESDDVLSDTIKRMRLGMNFSSSSKLQSTSSEVLVDTSEQVSNNVEYAEVESNEINLVIRLPKGTRVQHVFQKTDTIQTILKYLSKHMKVTITLSKYVLYLNEVPKKELKQSKSSLLKLDIKDRSVLTLDTRD